jgi:uncharacterized RDD family membrane protein YckC
MSATNADLYISGIGVSRMDADTIGLAGRGTRLGASLLDGLAMAVVPAIAVLVDASDNAPSGAGVGLAVLWVVAVSLYQMIRLVRTGQTLGKMWMGIKIVKLDDGPVTFGSAVLLRGVVGQGLLGIIPFYGLLDALFIFRGDRRCLHDLVAGTKVVQVDRA